MFYFKTVENAMLVHFSEPLKHKGKMLMILNILVIEPMY